MPDTKQKIINQALNFFINYLWIIIGCFALLIFILSYIFILKPKYDNISTSFLQQEEKINGELEERKKLLGQLNAGKKKLKSIDKYDLARLEAIMPRSKDIANGMKEFLILSEQGGFVLSGLSYAEQNSTGDIKSIRWKMSLSGDYNKLKAFLQMLANNVNIMDVVAINFGGNASYSLELDTYYRE